jgi:hypothetical protein
MKIARTKGEAEGIYVSDLFPRCKGRRSKNSIACLSSVKREVSEIVAYEGREGSLGDLHVLGSLGFFCA